MITKLWSLANDTADKIAALLADPLLLAIRLYWGWQFMTRGWGKLMNLGDTSEYFSSLGLPLPQLNAILASSTECFGGLLLLLGLFSRFISIPLIFTMVVAYLTADIKVVKGIFADPDAFVSAAPFLFMLAAVLVFVFGPGKFSTDELLHRRFRTA